MVESRVVHRQTGRTTSVVLVALPRLRCRKNGKRLVIKSTSPQQLLVLVTVGKNLYAHQYNTPELHDGLLSVCHCFYPPRALCPMSETQTQRLSLREYTPKHDWNLAYGLTDALHRFRKQHLTIMLLTVEMYQYP